MDNPNFKNNNNSNWLIICALFIPFFTTTIKNSGSIFLDKGISSYFSDLIKLIQLKSTLNDGIFIFVVALFTRVILFLLPFLIITCIELRTKKFKFTTLGRFKYSEGYKYADIWYLALNLLIRSFQQITIFTTLGLTLFASGIQELLHNLYLNAFPQFNWIYSSTLIFLILILSNDLIKYFVHRLSHNYPLFWDLHEFHHSATEMTILNQQRGFAIESVFTSFIFLPFSVLLSSALAESISNGNFLTLGIYIFDLMMTDFFAYLGHSSLKLIFPKPFNYIYMSPSLHWLHHSIDEKHWQCNFGEKYPFWDKLFGTYLDESHLNEVSHYGIYGGSEYNKHHPLYSYTIVPVLKILRRTGLLKMLKNT